MSPMDATTTAAAVRSGRLSAEAAVDGALERAAATDARLNCFTAILPERARERARAIDRNLEAGRDPGPLAGVPFAAKDLFDIAGIPTLAGSRINRDRASARADAALVARLEAAGAILVGALNMDEYAYGFTTENSHYGATRNPHDATRIAGGSSGGCGAAVAAGVVPLALGSDTNGSIRVPSALCGTFGLKPTYGRLPRTGTYPFVGSFDHLGPFARTVIDLATTYDALQGADSADPACAQRIPEPVVAELGRGPAGLRIAVAGGYFRERARPEALAAVDRVAAALGVTRTVELPEPARARAAAFVITAAEGGALHLDDLRARAGDFDPLIRDRLLAGALVPAAWYLRAQRFRQWFRDQVAAVFRTVDILLAPCTPFPATPIGQETVDLGGETVPLRPNVGIYTQPISFIGLPVVAVPLREPGSLPLGVQVIGAPWREADCLRVAACLESLGVTNASVPTPP